MSRFFAHVTLWVYLFEGARILPKEADSFLLFWVPCTQTEAASKKTSMIILWMVAKSASRTTVQNPWNDPCTRRHKYTKHPDSVDGCELHPFRTTVKNSLNDSIPRQIPANKASHGFKVVRNGFRPSTVCSSIPNAKPARRLSLCQVAY